MEGGVQSSPVASFNFPPKGSLSLLYEQPLDVCLATHNEPQDGRIESFPNIYLLNT